MAVAAVLLALCVLVYFVRERQGGDGISRALAAKSLALAAADKEECYELGQQKKLYFEGDWTKWYGKYMNLVYERGWFDAAEVPPDDAGALKSLTYGELKGILERMGVEASLPARRDKRPVERAVWWQVYGEIRRVYDKKGAVLERELIVYGTPANLEKAFPWTAYTSQGKMGFEGVGLDAYIDRSIRVLERDGEILTVLEKLSDQVVYENVWITQGDAKEATVFLDGFYREFRSHIWGAEAPEGGDNFGQVVGDIVLDKGVMTQIRLKEETISGKVLTVKEDAIEIEGYGELPLASSFRVFKQFGELASLSRQDILVGYNLQEFVVAGGTLCAALVQRDFQAEKIRVLLMSGSFSELLHEKVEITCDDAFLVSWGEESQEYSGGEVLSLDPGDERLSFGRLTVAPVREDHTLTILSLQRNYGNPAYPGILEISREEGGMAVVNETYLEDYLIRVVPSEMPASYSLEALKAQAVCARSYACRQIKSNSYSQYGAHVDDSTKFQVYNNIEPQERATRAVRETYGQVGYFDGEVIMAYYFSTSCGHTSDMGVWGGSREDCPYAMGRYLTLQAKSGDLRDEAIFREFIMDKNYDTFEKNMPWYRWETVIPATLLENAYPEVGAVTGLSVAKRGEGGVADQVVLTGSAGEKVFVHQDEIRGALCFPEMEIVKKDGSTADGWHALPSGYFAVEPELSGDGALSFRLSGGGYGHGVGMSQNGAKVMADMGMDYQTILKFFYQGIEVKEIGG